ncbi:MAG: hypothetical protein NWS46_04690 [Cyclobacteriaceae bacterium]|nr:hypothetical protein [Cyclobacteriaceae bacterium]
MISYVGILTTFWSELTITGDEALLGGILIFFSALTYATYLVGSGWLIPKFGYYLHFLCNDCFLCGGVHPLSIY